MLVSELRKEISRYDNKELQEIIVELYKRVSKAKKEEYAIDDFIKDVSKKQAKKLEVQDFETLKKEIVYFLNCVDAGYYEMPNKVISKKERSSWRFKVKRYYKELNAILPETFDGANATELLIEIFKRLSIGSNRLLFVNWDTFRALGVSQTEYYDVIMKRILSNNETEEDLKKCIKLLDVLKDPYELSYGMFQIFISNLRTVNMKRKAIEFLKNNIVILIGKLKNAKNYHEKFVITENLNENVECVVEIYCLLDEVEDGIDYYQKNYVESDHEVKEFILLEKLEELELISEWVKEYEQHIDKIDYRDSLKDKYKEFTKKKTIF